MADNYLALGRIVAHIITRNSPRTGSGEPQKSRECGPRYERMAGRRWREKTHRYSPPLSLRLCDSVANPFVSNVAWFELGQGLVPHSEVALRCQLREQLRMHYLEGFGYLRVIPDPGVPLFQKLLAR